MTVAAIPGFKFGMDAVVVDIGCFNGMGVIDMAGCFVAAAVVAGGFLPFGGFANVGTVLGPLIEVASRPITSIKATTNCGICWKFDSRRYSYRNVFILVDSGNRASVCMNVVVDRRFRTDC